MTEKTYSARLKEDLEYFKIFLLQHKIYKKFSSAYKGWPTFCKIVESRGLPPGSFFIQISTAHSELRSFIQMWKGICNVKSVRDMSIRRHTLHIVEKTIKEEIKKGSYNKESRRDIHAKYSAFKRRYIQCSSFVSIPYYEILCASVPALRHCKSNAKILKSIQ